MIVCVARFKGVDRATVIVENEHKDTGVDEVKQFLGIRNRVCTQVVRSCTCPDGNVHMLDLRYLCPEEAVTRLIGYETNTNTTSVVELSVVLPNEGKERPKTTLDAYFELNQRCEDARELTYDLVPERYRLIKSGKRFQEFKRAHATVGTWGEVCRYVGEEV